MKVKAGIVGGAGYAGGEMIRLLLNHPSVQLEFVQSRSQAGKRVDSIHADLAGDTHLVFTPSFHEQTDVLFLCMSHGESRKLLTDEVIPSSTRIIDLGNDFRSGDEVRGRAFVYGLPELQREKIRKAHNIANPGCFATAIQLGLLPVAKAGILGEVHVTAVTGSTGAGQKLQDSTHFTWRANNISAYKTLTHQHLGEIRRTLQQLQHGYNKEVNFVPWRGDFTRGIFATAVIETQLSLEEANMLFKDYYREHPFTHVVDHMVDIKQVVNTNKCLIFLEKIGRKLAIHTTLDNLVKGASGQAVQNMNLMMGLDEKAGLHLKSSVY